jgi:hypothetical protein
MEKLNSHLIITIDIHINKGEYKKWLERFPNSAYDIFKKMLVFGPKLTLTDFTTFSKYSVNFDKIYEYPTIYNTKTTALYYLAENKRYEELEILVKNFYRKKTKIKTVLENGYNILEVVLCGIKRDTGMEDVIHTEKCIHIIESHFDISNMVVQKWIIDTMCGDYIKYSLYLKDFISLFSR